MIGRLGRYLAFSQFYPTTCEEFASEAWVEEGKRRARQGKSSVTVCHWLVLEKLRKCGLRKWPVRWTAKVWAQRLVMSGTNSGWRQVSSGVGQDSYPCGHHCSSSSLMTWAVRQSAPSASRQVMMQNVKEWLRHCVVVALLRGSW